MWQAQCFTCCELLANPQVHEFEGAAARVQVFGVCVPQDATGSGGARLALMEIWVSEDRWKQRGI